MKIILLKDVAKLGRKYDVKDVNEGHALNFLIPQGYAVSATPSALKKLETDKVKTEMERRVQEELLAKNLKELENITLQFVGKANEKGHLFAGIHVTEIVSELSKQFRLNIDPSIVVLEHPIKEVGEHTVDIKNGNNKNVKLKIIIKAE
jgi:large subunit ribosomal protein L9